MTSTDDTPQLGPASTVPFKEEILTLYNKRLDIRQAYEWQRDQVCYATIDV